MAPLRRTVARVLACLGLLCATAAPAAPLRPDVPQLSLVLGGVVSQPADARSRGYGAGLQVAWRLTDQLGLTADAAQLGGRAGAFSTLAFGLTAILDSTPLAPFVGIAFVRLGPESVTQTGLATRTSLGADYHVTRAFAVGVEGRTITPLDSGGGGRALVSGAEIALRLVFHPAILK